MNPAPRNRVVWVGRQIPEALRQVTATLGLNLVATRNLQGFAMDAADLLAVIVAASGHDATKAFGRLFGLLQELHALDYGVQLAAAAKEPREAFALQGTLLQKTGATITALGLEANYFAAARRSPPTGPPANLGLKLVGHTPGAKEPDFDHQADAILLRRAFHDFTRLHLKSEAGSRSPGCRVWRIEAERGTASCQPFVAKAAPRADLQSEFETYGAFVAIRCPFPFAPRSWRGALQAAPAPCWSPPLSAAPSGWTNIWRRPQIPS